ncbi:leu operon leader peptide [Xenorhabdus sp. Flor]|nr:leu operon leader peptide [Xenorhabdus sp. Flor]
MIYNFRLLSLLLIAFSARGMLVD